MTTYYFKDYTGGIVSNAVADSGAPLGFPLIITGNGILDSIGVNWQGVQNGNVRVALYSAGVAKPGILLLESASTPMNAFAGWQDIPVAPTSIAPGLHWVAIQIDSDKGVYYNAASRSWYAKAYGAFDAAWSGGSTQDNAAQMNMRVNYHFEYTPPVGGSGKWIVGCYRPSAGPSGTQYYPPFGGVRQAADLPTEANSQFRMRGAYIVNKLFVNMFANTLGSNQVITTRKNSAPGNLTVTIGAGATGMFEDTTHSDSLADGDLYCVQSVSGAGGVGAQWLQSLIFEATTLIPIQGGLGTQCRFDAGNTNYSCTLGGDQNKVTPTGEENALYKWKIQAEFSRLRTYVISNNLSGQAVFRFGKNGSNGSQTLTIGASATGEFEDAANSDVITIGDKINVRATIAAGSGSIWCQGFQAKSSESGRICITNTNSTIEGVNYTIRYLHLEGATGDDLHEVDKQTKARIPFIARNLFVFVHGVDGGTVNETIMFRKNSADTLLTVTIGAGATGDFEDTIHLVSCEPNDLVDWSLTATGGFGAAFAPFGFQQDPTGGVLPASESGNIANKLVATGVI